MKWINGSFSVLTIGWLAYKSPLASNRFSASGVNDPLLSNKADDDRSNVAVGRLWHSGRTNISKI